jgi:hypothetical protein
MKIMPAHVIAITTASLRIRKHPRWFTWRSSMLPRKDIMVIFTLPIHIHQLEVSSLATCRKVIMPKKKFHGRIRKRRGCFGNPDNLSSVYCSSFIYIATFQKLGGTIDEISLSTSSKNARRKTWYVHQTAARHPPSTPQHPFQFSCTPLRH